MTHAAADDDAAFAHSLAAPETLSLDALAAQLEADPGECARAFQGLELIDSETRLTIIERLGNLPLGPGVRNLLELLESSRDDRARSLATEVLRGPGRGSSESLASRESVSTPAALPLPPRLVQTVVTCVDGSGQGSVGVSTLRDGGRNTALFLCDVKRGLVDAVGEHEDAPGAEGLLRNLCDAANRPALWDAPELALGLLAGSLTLGGPGVPAAVKEWLDRTLGPGFPARPLMEPVLARCRKPVDPSELMQRAAMVLEALPDWLDRSPLTDSLAEEIVLREGRVAADPKRDSGAFRYLFEHRIIERLELYRRMLLWMAWYWRASGDDDLSGFAANLAVELADEQNAVPGHPFVVALTARSLDAAQERLGSADDPARSPSGA